MGKEKRWRRREAEEKEKVEKTEKRKEKNPRSPIRSLPRRGPVLSRPLALLRGRSCRSCRRSSV